MRLLTVGFQLDSGLLVLYPILVHYNSFLNLCEFNIEAWIPGFLVSKWIMADVTFLLNKLSNSTEMEKAPNALKSKNKKKLFWKYGGS